MSKLSKSFLFATMGEQVLQQLESERTFTYAYVFPPAVTKIIEAYDPGAAHTDPEAFIRDVVTPVMEAFIEQACPKAADKPQILQKVFKWYLASPIPAVDLHKMAENLAYFDGVRNSPPFKQSGASPDLMSYKTYADFEAVLAPFLERRKERDAKAHTLYGLNDEQKKQVLAETTILYDGPDGCVVVPHTTAASQFWGVHAQWCVSGRTMADEYFPRYNAESPIVMLLPKGQEANKVALVDHLIYASVDAVLLELTSPHAELFENCLTSLPDGVREDIMRWWPEKNEALFHALMGQNRSAAGVAGITTEMLGRIEDEYRWICDGHEPHAELWRDRDFVHAFVRVDGESENIERVDWKGALFYAADDLKADREIVEASVARWGRTLEHASDALRADPAIVLGALQLDAVAFEPDVSVFGYAAEKLRADRAFVLAQIEKTPAIAACMSESLKADRAFVIEAAQKNKDVLEFLPDVLKDEALVMDALAAAGDTTGTYRDVALRVVARNAAALACVTSPLREDADFVREAVQRNAEALVHAPAKFRTDGDAVLDVVRGNNAAFAYAADDVKADAARVTRALADNDELPFLCRNMEGVWQPDDAALTGYQIKALTRMMATGKTEMFAKYARLCPLAWGDPALVFGTDLDARLAGMQARALPASANAPADMSQSAPRSDAI